MFESTRQAFDLLRHGEARIACMGVLRISPGHLPFTNKFLDQGQLAKVSDLDAEAEKHYRLINQYPESRSCCKFENWLITEASNTD